MSALATALAAMVTSTGCASTDESGSRGSSGSSMAPTCEVHEVAAVEAAAVPGKPDDWELDSFDGTVIRFHWFPAGGASEMAPTLLMGPGWGQAGETNDLDDPGIRAPIDVQTLTEHGYNVLTWDPRGFGDSGGVSSLNSPDLEGKDVQRLIDWVAQQPGVRLDAAGDPRMGMLGGSYGGSIQFVVAAADCRVDAIAPAITYHDYVTSLYRAETVKAGWLLLLLILGGGDVDEQISNAGATFQSTGSFSPENVSFLHSRGVADILPEIKIPTLIVQSTVDNLFSLDEAVTTFQALRDKGLPTRMVWYCGGHANCLTHVDGRSRTVDATLDWLDRWVAGDDSVDTGPLLRIVDQRGATYSAHEFPLDERDPVVGEGSGTLALVAGGGSGPSTAIPPAASASGLDGIFTGLSAARASNAVDVAIDTGPEPRMLVGAPQLHLQYRGTTPESTRPARVFAQLVDEQTDLVVGNQVTPVEITLDGDTHEVTTPLEMISFTADPGSRLTLQLVATTVVYEEPQLGGTIEFESVRIELPSVTSLVAD